MECYAGMLEMCVMWSFKVIENGADGYDLLLVCHCYQSSTLHHFPVI